MQDDKETEHLVEARVGSGSESGEIGESKYSFLGRRAKRTVIWVDAVVPPQSDDLASETDCRECELTSPVQVHTESRRTRSSSKLQLTT
jgi:hypothetical protein